jgi:NADPH:quinone reductase-like Zn-dependent oxidoreductase
MKAFALEGFGGQGSLRDLPVPEPAEGQLRLRVVAAGLNPFDVAVMQGYVKDHMEHRFPLVPGMDASGTVDSVGDGRRGLRGRRRRVRLRRERSTWARGRWQSSPPSRPGP